MDMLKKVWEGNERLVLTFWLWGVVGGFIVRFVVFLLLGSMPVLAGIIVLPYQVFIWVGVWRSSDNYKGANIWALLAKILVVLGVLGTVYSFFNPVQMPGF